MLNSLLRVSPATLLGFLTLISAAGTPASTLGQWKEVSVPGTWKSPPKGLGGYSWYRCIFKPPLGWQGKSLTVFVEPVDDAREVLINGQKVGQAGSFPPQFRSGLGSNDRHAVPAEAIRFGELNVLAIRVYDSDGRSGFNVAAPVLFAGDEALRCEGTWQFQAGDKSEWGQLEAGFQPADKLVFTQTVSRNEAEQILRRLPGEEGPLPPEVAVTRLKGPDDLAISLVLAEPAIGQPLFLQFDERGRMWVMNYLQYPNPAGLKAVSRDKFLRTVYDQTPLPPPKHVRGADKITFHEDTDGDGRFDRHQTFVDGLNMATSFARGRGGVWVLNPPYLLFYPDANQDDVPDGDPEVHLEGFGLEDSHSIVSNLRFGPDGWLYGAQGSTVTGNVRRYGSQDKPVFSMGQLIWRYHPGSRRYEIFAEGGGNTFGVEIDSKGRVYSGHNGGDTRGFHYVQGGYYQKGFGKHGELSNPYAFGYFPPMAHHSVPRFTHDFIIYEGAALSAQYAGKIFGVGPLQGHVVISDVQPLGTTFQSKDIGFAITSTDPWFRPVHLTPGPDGAIYVADFYEQRIDHASHYQGRVDKGSGRVYRIGPRPPAAASTRVDYSRATSHELLELLSHENRWHRETAQRLLMIRQEASLAPEIGRRLESATGQLALEYLWALHAIGGLDSAAAIRYVRHADPFVRLWTIRLLADRGSWSPEIQASVVEVARQEGHREVRSQLACSARRLTTGQCLPVVAALLAHDEDAEDSFVPLLLWWAIESHCGTQRNEVVSWFTQSGLLERPLVQRHILERIVRRFAQAGSRADLLACAKLLNAAPNATVAGVMMKGFEAAFTGRELPNLPPELTAAIQKSGGGSLALRLRGGDPRAIEEALAIVANPKAPAADRIKFAQVFGQVAQASAVPVLLQVTASNSPDDVRSAAAAALQAHEDPRIPEELIRQYGQFTPAVREVVLSVLASRPSWAGRLVAAVSAGQIAAQDVPRSVVHRMLFLRDTALVQKVKELWANVQDASTSEMREQVVRYTNIIGGGAGNPYQGKRLFDQNCGKCHVLFGTGGNIGPDLTSYKRDDLSRMLMNVINPSLEIREGFENFVIVTADGRTLNGFVIEQDAQVVVLKQADGQSVLVPRDDIEEMAAVPRSIMPEALLKDYGEQQVRDLFAYLRSTQPLP